MDASLFEDATHQAYYKTDRHRIRLLVFRSSESPQGWFYQLCDLDTNKFENFPVSDWVSGRTFAKQALDRGVYGVVWPHISNAAQAYNAVSACRYPRLKSASNYEPAGARGDGPTTAARYWGLSQQDYYKKADVWPLVPQGELLVFLMIEDTQGIANLDDILKNVPGIGCVLIGEGDLSQELGYPRQYEHPIVLDAMSQILGTCKKHNIPVGHPHVTSKNVERVLAEGYRFLMSAPVRGYATIEKARTLSGA